MSKIRFVVATCAAVYALALFKAASAAQMPDTYFDELSLPAVAYSTQQPHDPIAELNEKLAHGSVTLTAEPTSGYLRSVLKALQIPIESQLAVFSKTSVQAEIINPGNPRALFFNDVVVVGWPRGGFIEAASVDPRLGVIFYALDQEQSQVPRFERRGECVTCHLSAEATLSIPGMLLRSLPTLATGRTMPQLGSHVVDHRLPFDQRWGGWYVTGRNVGVASLGNLMLAPSVDADTPLQPDTIRRAMLPERLQAAGYLSPYSDVAALMVFDHQMHMTNLLARMSWEARAAEGRADAPMLMRAVARDVVDYMLFVDEARLPEPIEGSSGFAEWFSAQGPRDSRGRSLRQLDLKQRLLRYPCSYMIFSDAFDGLPDRARAAIYDRMWVILSGQDRDPRYARLSADDRRDIIQILRETKKGLPAVFQ
jgi:hypothetical protein